MDLWTLERGLWAAGIANVCGCDEAGAGPLAGPVYAAAAILPQEINIPGLDDSKKLTAKRREALYQAIAAAAVSWSVARVEAAEIDATDILSARMKAMQLAIDGLSRRGAAPPEGFLWGGACVRPDLALIDGNRDCGKSAAILAPHQTVVGGDGKSASVAAASILAKVSRDRYVTEELDALYPQYAFAKHKGYGTKLHYELLDRYGPCPAHRKSFLRTWEARRHVSESSGNQTGIMPEKKSRKAIGNQGEETAARALQARGFTILARQWHCRYGELDLIAQSPEGVVCFVEVKLRSANAVAPPRAFVDARKQNKLRLSASLWLSARNPDAPARFDVAEVYALPDGSLQVEYLENAFE